jgi:hypothetical protein
MNTRHEVSDWFAPLYGVIVIRSVLMYYAIEMCHSLFLSESFGDVLNVDLFSLFIVGEPPQIV